jgi:hypothetical protein
MRSGEQFGDNTPAGMSGTGEYGKPSFEMPEACGN